MEEVNALPVLKGHWKEKDKFEIVGGCLPRYGAGKSNILYYVHSILYLIKLKMWVMYIQMQEKCICYLLIFHWMEKLISV